MTFANQEALKPLTLKLAQPRGFCAGVVRAIDIVEKAIENYGSPVYVRHEIVHNRKVVQDLEAMGAIFVDELDQVPDDRPVIFSAHGVPKSVPAAAQDRKLFALDATCPLVSKVHREVERNYKLNRHILLIGHKGHPEVIGTMGQLPMGSIDLIENEEDVATLELSEAQLKNGLAYATQTTLSLKDTAMIIAALKAKYPNIHSPKQEDICYATTNRQEAMIKLSADCQAIIVIGAPNSSNSQRLVDVAIEAGCKKSYLIQNATEIDWNWLDGVETLGLSAGASAPEALVQEVIEACRHKFSLTVDTIDGPKEDIVFKLPKELVV